MQNIFFKAYELYPNDNTSDLNIGAVFCWVITIALALALIWLIYIVFRKNNLRTKKSLGSLKEVNEGDQKAIQEALERVQKADKHSTTWKNFKESMVEDSFQGETIYKRTSPSSTYINPSSVNPSLFNGYLLSWIPSVLTTLGVLGTFMGLAIGLSGLHFDVKSETDAKPQVKQNPIDETTETTTKDDKDEINKMLNGIKVLIDGSKTAFYTSIWGVSSGIIFGLAFRISRQCKANQIRNLAHRLDELIAEVSPEDDLRKLRDSNEHSEEHLLALIEKIGPSLQKTLTEMPMQIGAAIGEEIKNAVGAIGKQSSEDLGASLQNVYKEHLADLSGLAQAIGEQSQMTQNIISQLSKLPGELERSTTQLNSGASSLESVSERFGGWDDNLREYSEKLDSSSGKLDLASGHLEVAATTLASSVPNLEGAAKNIQTTHQANQAQLDGGSKELVESFGEITKVMGDFVTTGESLKDVSSNLNTASSKFEKLADTMQQGHENQKLASENNKSAATRFEEVSGHFEGTAKHLEKLGNVSEDLNTAGRAAADGFSTLKATLTGLNDVTGELEKISQSFKEVTADGVGEHFSKATQALEKASAELQHLSSVSTSLDNASEMASRTFGHASEEHQTFVNGLAVGVKALAEQVDQLLESYGNNMNEQTQQRIQEWNKASTDFGVQFSTKVDDLHGAIEDLDQTLKTR